MINQCHMCHKSKCTCERRRRYYYDSSSVILAPYIVCNQCKKKKSKCICQGTTYSECSKCGKFIWKFEHGFCTKCFHLDCIDPIDCSLTDKDYWCDCFLTKEEMLFDPIV